MTDAVPWLLVLFATIRTAIGLAPFLATEPLVRWLGFPEGESTTSAVVFARLFGVRDIGLGATIAWAIPRPDLWLALIALNAAVDLGDLLSFALGMQGRPDLRRPLGLCAAVAGGAVVAWGLLAAWISTG